MPDQVQWAHVNLTYTDDDGKVIGNEILTRGALVPDEGLNLTTRENLRVVGAIRLVDYTMPAAVTDARAVANAPLPAPEETREPEPVPPPDLVGVGGQSPAKLPPAKVSSDEDAPPPVNAAKADWVDYAVTHGMSQEEAEGTSKEQLVGRFGRR